jgi:hypothetical protein
MQRLAVLMLADQETGTTGHRFATGRLAGGFPVDFGRRNRFVKLVLRLGKTTALLYG